jgi:hypothetical protein
VTPPGTSARIVASLGGMVADPSDDVAVAAALRAIVERGPCPPGEVWGNAEVRAGFAAAEVAAKMDDMIARVTSSRGS